MQNERKRQRLTATLRGELAQFLGEELHSSPGTMVSVTYVIIAPNSLSADIFVSVFPRESSPAVEKALKGVENRASRFLYDRLRLRRKMTITFIIDKGEEMREHITELIEKSGRSSHTHTSE